MEWLICPKSMSFREPYMRKLVHKICGWANPLCHYPQPVGTAVSSRGGKSFRSLFQSPSPGEAAPSGWAPLRQQAGRGAAILSSSGCAKAGRVGAGVGQGLEAIRS